MSAVDILRKAASLIEERAAQRDRPDGEKSMLSTVAAFNVIYGTELTEVQGWHFMELLKMVRSAYGIYVKDDFDDKVAYAALAAEAADANAPVHRPEMSAKAKAVVNGSAPCGTCSNVVRAFDVCDRICNPDNGWVQYSPLQPVIHASQ